MKSAQLNFKEIVYPELCPKLVNFKDWHYYLTDKDEQWTKELQKLYYESSVHAAILNNLNQMVFGTGFLTLTPLDELILKSLKYDEILRKCIFDFDLYGQSYLYIKWNDEHTKIVEIKHIKYEQIKIGDINVEMDEVDIYFHCTNWDKNKYKNRVITPLIKFNVDPNSDPQQIYPLKYNDMMVYSTPYYNAGLRNIQESIEIDKWYLHLAETGFGANKMFLIPGSMEEREKDELEWVLKNNYSGAEGFKNIVLYPEDPNFKPEIIAINNEDISSKYGTREEQLRQNIISAHQLPSPLLIGEKTAGQLGAGEEFKTAYVIYKHRMVYPTRKRMTDMFEDINAFLINPLSQIRIDDIEFEFSEKPIAQQFELTPVKNNVK